MRNWTNAAFHFYFRQRFKIMQRYIRYPHQVQQEVLQNLIKTARFTEFGKKYDFASIRTPEQYAKRVPLHTYEDFKPYIDRMMLGEKDVLWDGRVRYYSKSSGTTSGRSKFIPVPRQNFKRGHMRGSFDSMSLMYINRPDVNIFGTKNLLIGGSLAPYEAYPKTEIGDISAFLVRSMPIYARPFFALDPETAMLAEWEEKMERIAQIGAQRNDITLLGGVPTWVIVLLRRILEITGKSNMMEVWPNFQVYMHGGVSFTPYRAQFKEFFFPSDQVSYLEIYNASEGYFAAQYDLEEEGMLLFLNNGMYFEFLPMEEWGKERPKTIPLSGVEMGKNYALVISTNAGLWRYIPGDTISFTSTNPYCIKITGRTKEFVNAFGEEVMVENTDQAIAITCKKTGAQIVDYTVAPFYFGNNGSGGHEWLIEFKKAPHDMEVFNQVLDDTLQQLNSDYEAKRYKDIALKRLVIRVLPENAFHSWLRSKGKYGGQNKVPKLANHRKYVEEILDFVEV